MLAMRLGRDKGLTHEIAQDYHATTDLDEI